MGNVSSFAISPFSLIGTNTPTIVATTLTLANIEVPYALPIGTGSFLIQVRSGGSVFFGYAAGSTYTIDSLRIPTMGFFSRGDILNTVPYTLYFQSPVAGTIVVVESWKST